MGARKHGFSVRINGKQNLTYTCWQNMLQRCNRKNHSEYPNYGARGITVCERWHDFSNFLADMGEKPAGLSIDRIDNNLGYEPGNCRWADTATQVKNRSITKLIAFGGETRTIDEWADVSGINRTTIDIRLRRGWSPEDAVSSPIQKKRPQNVQSYELSGVVKNKQSR